jgi:hypothetical protein
LDSVTPKAGVRFIALKGHIDDQSTLYEAKWLQDLFSVPFLVESVDSDRRFDTGEDLVALLMKPKMSEQLEWLEKLRSAGNRFKILHFSDEYGNDPIHMYGWPEVTGVLRFYSRPDLPVDPKVLVIPLGYHWQFKGNRDAPHASTPNLPFRELTWSFAGTDWKGRSKDLDILRAIEPHYLAWFQEWKDPKQLKEDEYIALLLNSKFVPCPRGQNVETYRFYEALECGCIPLVLFTPENDGWIKIFKNQIPFLKLENWGHAAALLQHFSKNPEQMEQYRNAILVSWANYKRSLKETIRAFMKN